MKKLYLFDVDGTLTPSRQTIDKQFKEFFIDFCCTHTVALVSGSDYSKTLEQLGKTICSNVFMLFNNSGNEIRCKGEITHQHSIKPTTEMYNWFFEKLRCSLFENKTGNHIELRSGSLNFSILGRNANPSDRVAYKQWDAISCERIALVREFNELFPSFEACRGGETGIDICERGKNKSQVLEYIPATYSITFFGDSMSLDGNDYPLAQAILRKRRGIYYSVSSWRQTYEYLQYIS